MSRYLIPLAIFIVLVVFLGIGLTRDPQAVPSALLNKPAPAFTLPQLQDPTKSFSAQEMRGKVWMLNVWASWCEACLSEHPLLVQLSESGIVPIYGLNYMNEREPALAWLQEFGNPYAAVAFDSKGRVGMDFGVYKLPESFLIDKEGVVRYKQIGPFSAKDIEKTIIPMVKELNK